LVESTLDAQVTNRSVAGLSTTGKEGDPIAKKKRVRKWLSQRKSTLWDQEIRDA
jgi:hypothetical protein